MIATTEIESAEARAAAADSAGALRLVCSEVFGGNRPIRVPVDLPGMRGALFSAPCDGGRGGDIHYLSVCGSGLQSRGCIADVVGHGEAVAAFGSELHGLMRRYMNYTDQRRVLMDLNRRAVEMGFRAMTTAIAFTYYPPNRSFSISSAGHPPAWLFCRATNRWTRLPVAETTAAPGSVRPPQTPDYTDLPLGVEGRTKFTRHRTRVAPGDRVVLLTDGILEAPAPDGALFGDARVEAVLQQNADASPGALADALLRAATAHIAGRTADGGPHSALTFSHDDVTLFVADFVAPPRGPAIWHAFRNRLLHARGNSASPQFADPRSGRS